MGPKVIKFFIWLILVCIWNFSFPDAAPIYDVLVAIILSFIPKLDSLGIHNNYKST